MGVKERIFEYIDKKGLNPSRFEKMAHLSNGYLKGVKENIGSGKIEDILQAFPDLNRVWLMTGEGEMLKSESEETTEEVIITGKLIPLYDAGAAAGETYAADMTPAKIAGMIDIGSILRDSEHAIRVYGNSMVPNYPAGCIIGTRPHIDSFIEPGRVYVIETRGGRYIKRLYYNDSKEAFQCISDNHMIFEDGPRKGKPCYPDFEVPIDEVLKLHKVVGVIKRNIL